MNKIVREHYPVERLPEDLRAELGLVQTVTLVIETDGEKSRSVDRAAAIAELLEHRRTLRPSADDSVERVRKLRDEWDS
ncbi:hypothetical protein [Bosea sp. PAMC 26642]|uniref:hypothetical protein n=1 Tax=Bosea sp. (strain PAMC 26642) TaxID=1792307 RepID=UPI00076FE276|nr:hypothetical protein [Bosea sp. PAMC 26642]AMJ63279.1 hypothetical protein AXW83_25915 [Bosea sp. PAMC 26642]